MRLNISLMAIVAALSSTPVCQSLEHCRLELHCTIVHAAEAKH
jgi:hypothetical protein